MPARRIPIARPVLGRSRPQLSQQQAGDIAELLRRQGAIVDVQISIASTAAQAAGQQGQALPQAQTVKGLIDTGASISTVSDDVAASAGLAQVGSVEVGGVGGSGMKPIYAARLSLPQYGVALDPIEMAGVTIPFADVKVLIGRDVLKRLSLDYVGPAGTFDLVESGGVSTPGAGPAIPTPVIIGAVTAAGILGILFVLDIL
jgi:hypothetical protein